MDFSANATKNSNVKFYKHLL